MNKLEVKLEEIMKYYILHAGDMCALLIVTNANNNECARIFY
jgi:hypothetical protein